MPAGVLISLRDTARMIKALATRPNGGRILTLGLSKINMDRLLDNQPIPIKLRDLDPDLPDLDIVIIGGDTEESLMEDLRAIGWAP